MEHHHSTTRPHHHHQHHGGGSGSGGREDCWSEGATAILIEAWGDRYLQLSRGNLRQQDWKEVADAVNNRRQDGSKKPPRTDIQCKNRIDTIKKKYKLEKSKAAPSQWPFFTRLDQLIGTASSATAVNKKVSSLPYSYHNNKSPAVPAVTFTVKNGKRELYSPNPNPNPLGIMYSGGSSSKSRLNSHGSTESSGGGGEEEEEEDGGDDDDDDDTGEEDEMVFDRSRSRSNRKHKVGRNSTEGSVFREFARAISKFGEIYERIESSKQQQMVELERQRMDFTKEIEFQRMQMFMEAQLELEKTKRPKYSSSTGKK